MKILLLTLLLTRVVERESAEIDYLDGLTAETSHLPLELKCEARYGYIQVGGITINSKNINTKLQKQAENECEDQLKNIGTSASHRSDSTCRITFGRDFSLNSTDLLRAVYKCYDSKPGGAPVWTKQSGTGTNFIKTVVQPRNENRVTLECSADTALIVPERVYWNGNPLDEVGGIPDPTWTKEGMRKECYGQAVEKMKSKNNRKEQVKCEIKNTKGGTLKVVYTCVMPI